MKNPNYIGVDTVSKINKENYYYNTKNIELDNYGFIHVIAKSEDGKEVWIKCNTKLKDLKLEKYKGWILERHMNTQKDWCDYLQYIINILD